MPSGQRFRRPTSALIGALALALGLGGASFLLCSGRGGGVETDALLESGAAARESELLRPAEPPVASEARAQVELAGETARANPPPVDAPLRLRFVRGTTGRPAPQVAVRILGVNEDDESGLPVPAAEPLAEGRSDAHGWFAAPSSARGRAFRIEVDLEDGRPGLALPDFVRPDRLPADGSALEVEVLGAWAAFEALVLDDARNPVPGASVQFDFESPSLAFSTRDLPSTRATTNAEGIASIELVDPASSGGRMRIKAESAGILYSESVELPPPLSSTRVELHLSTSARAIVRVETAAGTPILGAMARIERLDAPFTSVGRSTDLDGTASFLPLEPGRYVASAEDPSTGSGARTEFAVAPCQLAEMRLTIPPSELPLAVAGSVLGADGSPVTWMRVSICVDGREEARLTPDRAGRFAYHRAPCERLRVRLKAPFDGPRVDPEIVEARFGEGELCFVLSDAPQMGFAALWVVDAETGDGLNGVCAAVFRDSAAERIGGVVSAFAGSALSLASNEAGLLFVPSGARMPRAHLRVEKRGYVRREIDLTDLSGLPERAGRPTLELRRGFVQRWIVRDARTGAPVPGAVATRGVDPFTGLAIEDGSVWGPSAPSDARGILELALPHAPTRVSIQARGYRPRAVEVGLAHALAGASLPIEDSVLLDSTSDL